MFGTKYLVRKFNLTRSWDVQECYLVAAYPPFMLRTDFKQPANDKIVKFQNLMFYKSYIYSFYLIRILFI